MCVCRFANVTLWTVVKRAVVHINCLIYWIPMRYYQAALEPPLHSHYRDRWTDKHTRSSAPVHLLLHCRSWGRGPIRRTLMHFLSTLRNWKCVKWLSSCCITFYIKKKHMQIFCFLNLVVFFGFIKCPFCSGECWIQFAICLNWH